MEEVGSGDPRLETMLLSTAVNSELYRELVRKIDSAYPLNSPTLFAGNIFKRHLKEEMMGVEKSEVGKVLAESDALFESYKRMLEGLKSPGEALMRKLKIGVTGSADSLAEAARRNGVSSPEEMALVKIIAIFKGVNRTLKDEYISYVDALYLPDIILKYEELE